MKYTAWDLFEHITTRSDISCSSCKNSDYIYEAGEAEDFYFERGWRATKHGNVYCPKCAKKKLKLK